MTFGLLLAGAGLLLLSRISIETPYLLMAPVFAIMGIGIGATMAPMTAAVMNAVGPERAGLGSATTNSAREVGGVFGIALLGTILTTRLNTVLAPALAPLGLAPATQASIETTAGHGTLDPSELAGLPLEQRGAVVAAFRESWMNGFRLALLVAGLVLLIAAVVANRFIPGQPTHARSPRPPGWVTPLRSRSPRLRAWTRTRSSSSRSSGSRTRSMRCSTRSPAAKPPPRSEPASRRSRESSRAATTSCGLGAPGGRPGSTPTSNP